MRETVVESGPMGEEARAQNPDVSSGVQAQVHLYDDEAGSSSAGETVAGQILAPAGPPPAPAEAGEARPKAEGYERFATGELAIVCSNYDLGRIHSVREFKRGSRQAPKVVLETSSGHVLIKRRSPGKTSAAHISFSHSVQNHLAERSFPLARLIPTATGAGSLSVGGFFYEVFEFVHGKRYDRSIPPTAEAGRALAYFHRLLSDYAGPGSPTTGSYHAYAKIPEALRRMRGKVRGEDSIAAAEKLADLYELAVMRVRESGIAGWPRQVIHSDYHPGNVIFAEGGIRAIVDFDSARQGPRALDVANGALQFSVTRTGLDPLSWPVELDKTRLKAFLGAYDAVEGCILSRAECRALPWLMIEALIVEATIPIASTGRFGQIEGGEFLQMVEKKAAWLCAHTSELIAI